MAALTEQELKKQMGTGAFAPLYILYGEEKYLVRRAAERLIDKAAGDSFPEFNRNELSNSATVDEIADAAQALPLFSEHKCVSVADFDVEEKTPSEIKKLSELLDGLPESTSLVFFYPTLHFDGKKSAKWRNFLKEADKVGCTVCCNPREVSELQRLLQREAEKAGCILSKQNAGLIIDYAGRDLTRLLNEMEKLCAFAETGEITREHVEELVSKSVETTVFLMANALVAGNHEKAYLLLDQLFYQNEEPVMVLGALAASYVDMYRVKAAVTAGLTASAAAECGEYRGKEFRLKNAERAGRGVALPVLRESLGLLLQADVALKSSRLSPRLIMDSLVARLLLAGRRAEDHV